MGLMTELFVATPERAATYDVDSGPTFERFQLGDFTNLQFEMLWAILEGEEWDPDKHGLREIVCRDDGAQFVFQFPPPFVERLRSLTADAKVSAAATWAAMEEVSADQADVAPIIDNLVALSEAATKGVHGLFVWFSL
jgi:hypothetical protein